MLSWSGSLSVILVNFRKWRETFDLLCDRASPPGILFPRNESCESYARYLKKPDQQIDHLIQEGYTHFLTGLAEGADVDFARCVLLKKEKFPHIAITLEASLPYPYSPIKRMGTAAAERAIILAMCDQVTEVSPYYRNGCMQKRNLYMVDKSNLIPAIWNGIEKGGTWNTIQSARHKEKSICYILLHE